MSTPAPDSSVIRKAEWKRRFRAFLVSTCACFLVLSLAWSFSTSRYLAQNRIGLGRLTAETESEDAKERVRAIVQQAWQQGTTPEAIQNHLLRMKGIDPGDSNAPQVDTSSILDSINCQIVDQNGNLQLLLSLEGRGSVVERSLIDRIAVKLASDIALLPIQTLVEFKEKSQHNNRLVEAANRLDASIARVRSAQRNANLVSATLEEMHSEVAEENRLNSLAAYSSQQSLNELERLINQLEEQKHQLEGQRAQLAGLPDSEPRNLKLNEQLLTLQDELQSLQDQQLVLESKVRQTSPFRIAGFAKRDAGEGAGSSNAYALSDTLRQLDRELQDLKREMVRADLEPSIADGLVPVFVRSFEKARIVPRNGIRFLGPFLLLCMLSTIVGSVIALRYQPLADDVGFDHPQQLSDLLRVPVVAEIRSKDPAESAPKELPWPNLAVKAGELIVLTALCMIACMLLFSPAIRASFADNPMHGLSEILWRIQGK